MARSSAYSTLLSLAPPWVLGGDFGDTTKLLNNRELSDLTVERQAQENEKNQIALDEAERQKQLEDALKVKFGENRPATLRDLYKNMADTALEKGDLGSVEKALTNLDKLKRSDLSDLTSAINVADNMPSFEELDKHYPGILSKEAWAYNQKKKKSASEQSRRRVTLLSPSGQLERVSEDEYNDKIRQGYYDPSIDPQDIAIIQRQIQRSNASPPPSSGGALVPYSDPTPAAAVSGRGDVARQGPSVEDQVRDIKRKRSVARG